MMSVLLLVPAKTFRFVGAWRMMITLFVPMFILGSYLYFKKPELLKKRLSTKEDEGEQKLVILFSAIMFISSFLLCGFDYKYSWSKVPMWLIVLAIIVFLITYLGFIELLKENEYLSRTVEVQDNQKVKYRLISYIW